MKNNWLLIILTALLAACGHKKETTAYSLTEKAFGTLEGKPVTEYSIINPSGTEVSIINYGGAVTRLLTADKKGVKGDVVYGFDNLDGYTQAGNPYFGALIGRYGNRIAHAKFTLDGHEYSLAPNNNGNTLHGGIKGFDKVYWNIEKMPGDSSLRLTYTSPDGEEGYPGTLACTVIYTLTRDNALKIEYSAVTDKPTPVNLTSHGYFNLSAGKDSNILNHTLYINANAYTPVDSLLIPTGAISTVAGTPMDFNMAKPIGKDIDLVPGGFDHNWVLNRSGQGLEKAAVLTDPASGRIMEVWTTEPGLQFYSGNFLNGSLAHTKNGVSYVNHGSLCLEAQHYPDSPNEPGFPSTILHPGETYSQVTVYKFSVNKDN